MPPAMLAVLAVVAGPFVVAVHGCHLAHLHQVAVGVDGLELVEGCKPFAHDERHAGVDVCSLRRPPYLAESLTVLPFSGEADCPPFPKKEKFSFSASIRSLNRVLMSSM